MKRLLCLILFCLFYLPKSYGYAEFSAQFQYSKQVYGEDRQNSVVDRTYSGSLATYLFGQYTALEFNYSVGEEITTQNETVPVDGTNTSLTGYQNTAENTVYGVGIRQAFASKRAFFRPMISLGYAKQFLRGYTDYKFTDTTTGTTVTVTDDIQKTRTDSVFATFSLQLRFTQHLAFRGSVNTVFPAFEYDQAKDGLKYLLGFTWIL